MKKIVKIYSYVIIVFLSILVTPAFSQTGNAPATKDNANRNDTILTLQPHVTDTAIIAVPQGETQSDMPTAKPSDIPSQNPGNSGNGKAKGTTKTKKTTIQKKSSSTIKTGSGTSPKVKEG